MEKFKALEKELKTKAYSKEGLNAATKMDPAEREKMELESWISDTGSLLMSDYSSIVSATIAMVFIL